MGSRSGRVVGRVALGLAALQVGFWWLVLPGLDSRGLLESNGIGASMFAVAAALKIAVLAALLVDLTGAHAAIGSRAVDTWRAALAWGVPLLAAVLLLALFRDPIAARLDTATAHLMSHRFVGYESIGGELLSGDRVRHRAWIAAWDSGRILFSESAFVLALVVLNVAIARRLDARPWHAACVGAVASVALCGIWTAVFGMVVDTYDRFYEGILAGPLLFDLVPPVVPRPLETPIGAVAYLAIALGDRWIERAARLPHGA
jgi:hypothetical protein